MASLDRGDRKETGRGLIVSGWLVLLFDALVVFFVPVAHSIGDNKSFMAIIFGLAAIAVVLFIAGAVVRRRATRGL